MPMQRAKQMLFYVCPPFIWKGLRLLKNRFRGNGLRVATTLEELDREIALADEAARISDDAMRRALAGFRFAARSPKLALDPDSREYRQTQMDLYKLVSGRDAYASFVNEHTPFDLQTAAVRPFPYSTRSFTTVGEQLMSVGFLIRAMALETGGSILEFGPGWGLTTLELIQMRYDVTAVDVNPLFLDLIGDRARRLEQSVSLVNADMLEYRAAQRFDRVLFYECFHHCSDHQRLVSRLDELVAPGGAVVFAGEPIDDDFAQPWGLRLDGMSVWSIRKFGWLELGFRTDYFRQLLNCHGWRLDAVTSQDVPGLRVFIARRLKAQVPVRSIPTAFASLRRPQPTFAAPAATPSGCP